MCRRKDGEDYQSFGEDYRSPSCRVRYLSAIAELRDVQSTEIIRAATRKTMMSRNPAAENVCGRESALYTEVVQ